MAKGVRGGGGHEEGWPTLPEGWPGNPMGWLQFSKGGLKGGQRNEGGQGGGIRVSVGVRANRFSHSIPRGWGVA